MKIHFDNVNWQAGNGPNVFGTRLAKCFFEMGHDIVLTGRDADISLVFIERSGNELARKVVQRLDGIWFRPNEFEVKNRGIKALYREADGIVWQSSFDEGMTRRWWGEPHGQHTVIHNGIAVKPCQELTHPGLIKIRNEYERIYVCSANWHPQKRLRANIELFERLRKKRNSCLFIMGSAADVRIASPHVFYTGSLSEELYTEIYAVASWMLHLAWADHCPNVVVEALAQGTPIVCSNVGGTRELVGDYGLVIEDQPYNYELADYDNPPIIDTSMIEDLSDRLTLDYNCKANIHIEHTARCYVDFFERIINE